MLNNVNNERRRLRKMFLKASLTISIGIYIYPYKTIGKEDKKIKDGVIKNAFVNCVM